MAKLALPDGKGFSGERHRILRAIQSELNRHPIVTDVKGQPPSTFTELRATLVPNRWNHDTTSATLRVAWQPIDPPEWAFHYSEPGFDCGWHHEPNPHVSDWSHYQERESGEPYEYEEVTFEGETPTELVWEIMERLRNRLGRHG